MIYWAIFGFSVVTGLVSYVLYKVGEYLMNKFDDAGMVMSIILITFIFLSVTYFIESL